MAKDHGPSVKDDEQYEGLRKKGMSKQRAASIANSPNASSAGDKKSGKGRALTPNRGFLMWGPWMGITVGGLLVVRC